MGVRHMQKVLPPVLPCSWSALSGKSVAVDISVYSFQFKSNQCLLGRMHRMLSLFRIHGIQPIFVFDGKPPEHKRDVLIQRWQRKQEYEHRASQLTQQYADTDEPMPSRIKQQVARYQKRAVTIRKTDKQQLMQLITLHGFTYVCSDEEADGLCAAWVHQGHVWGVMSEDMDMLVYGCSVVIRNVDIVTETVCVYSYATLLTHLRMSSRLFTYVCVLSGTDYHPPFVSLPLPALVQWVQEYPEDPEDMEAFGRWCQLSHEEYTAFAYTCTLFLPRDDGSFPSYSLSPSFPSSSFPSSSFPSPSSSSFPLSSSSSSSSSLSLSSSSTAEITDLLQTYGQFVFPVSMHNTSSTTEVKEESVGNSDVVTR